MVSLVQTVGIKVVMILRRNGQPVIFGCKIHLNLEVFRFYGSITTARNYTGFACDASLGSDEENCMARVKIVMRFTRNDVKKIKSKLIIVCWFLLMRSDPI